MIRINLLPHRQEKRAARKRQMVAGSVACLLAGLVVASAAYFVFSGWVEEQRARNAYLQGEITKLDKEIEKISDVKQRSQDMLSRKQIVEGLQTNRAEAVHVLDQMVRLMPEGTWLKSIKQTDALINITGYAQSNARVSTFMRSLDGSQWLEKPELVEIKAATVNNKRASEFSLNVRLKRTKAEGEKAGAKAKEKTA
jgi:type IV pilus assembly protein PilN